MNTLWTISIVETGLVTIENGGFTCVAYSSENLERQLEGNGFSRAEILEVFLQLSAGRKAVINIEPVHINIQRMSDVKIGSFPPLAAG